MSQRFELEQLYFQAKEAYYTGEPLMNDDEFDKLEQELITMGSDAPYIVGADDRKAIGGFWWTSNTQNGKNIGIELTHEYVWRDGYLLPGDCAAVRCVKNDDED